MQRLLLVLAVVAAAGIFFMNEQAAGNIPVAGTPVSSQPQTEQQPLPTAPGAEGDSAAQPVTGQVQTRIHTIDVGQGDACLIQQNGVNCLIDAGTKASADTLVAYLKKEGVEKLDYVIMTHAHADHIGGMPQVFENFQVGCVVLPDFSLGEMPTTVIFNKTLDAIEAQPDCEVLTASVGLKLPLSDGVLTVVGAGIKTDNQNNLSVCTLFEAPGVRYLNTGDAEKEYEEELVKSGLDLQADIFKAGHHGSATSNTKALLAQVSPKYVAISCGAGNDYGHPHQEALANFAAVNAQVARTDESGSIVYIVSDGKLGIN